ncbi:hypothetical protein ZHAS_00018881 [Anopheles sinensis]|uniref:RRM domain-containing protein n=1 Tax=Anopheles sinensis TaxID=74873 RepID=A0A084WK22_ANOSI|nr:hypothetical protein ZHAS_00018881 [Anopheles sinensis]
MKMSKLSNQTNSQDPQAVNSRVFVGNLNTFQCSKTDVERMFQRYGRLAATMRYDGEINRSKFPSSALGSNQNPNSHPNGRVRRLERAV